jgi:hypothetical protein
MTKVNMGMLEQPVHEPLDPEFMPTIHYRTSFS